MITEYVLFIWSSNYHSRQHQFDLHRDILPMKIVQRTPPRALGQASHIMLGITSSFATLRFEIFSNRVGANRPLPEVYPIYRTRQIPQLQRASPTRGAA